MNKPSTLKLLAVVLLFAACREEFNDHFNSDSGSTVGMNVVQILQSKEDFSLFARLIERAGLTRTLGESAIYTVLAPKNKDVETWLNSVNYSADNVPLNLLIPWINYHFVTGRNYVYDLEKGYTNLDLSLYPENEIQYSASILRSTRGDDKYDAKFIRLFTHSYLTQKTEDYKLMRYTEPGDFMVEGAPVSPAERDIPASNGVVHVLEAPLPVAPRCDLAIGSENDLTIVKGWLDLFKREEVKGMDSHNQIDTTKIPVYDLSMIPSADRNSSVCDIANEKYGYTAMLPTDAAIRSYLGPYMNEEQFGTDYNEIPKQFLLKILKNFFYRFSINGTYTSLGLSDFEINDYIPSYGGAILTIKNDLRAMYAGSLLSSNAIIYKLNTMPVLPVFTSIEAGLYINQKHYSYFHKLMELTSLSPSFTDEISYQHPAHTLLLQPDAEWEKSPDEYEERYRDTLYYRIRSVGDILENVQDGKFEHKYYQTTLGSALLYEDGIFTDYKGNKLELVSDQPVYSAENGAIYDIRGMGEILYTTDTTYTIGKQLDTISDLSIFTGLCKTAKMTDQLKQVAVNNYTLFAPVNSAFEGMDLRNITESEAKAIVSRHLILNRKIYTDGYNNGAFTTVNNTELKFSGAWDNFTVTAPRNSAGVVPEIANRQASNGVFHAITKILSI